MPYYIGGMEPSKWSVPSNDGWHQCDFVNERWIKRNNELLVVARLTVQGKNWDQVESLEKFENAEVVDHSNYQLNQIIIPHKALTELVNEVEHWLKSPRNFKVQLCDNDQQLLSIAVEDKHRLITSKRKPVFSLACSSGRTGFECHYIIDPTCLSILHEGLVSSLQLR